ncbi:Ig-like domain-containing domain [Paenibacillus sp. CMAA1364]
MKKILSVALSTAMAFSMFASVAFGDTLSTQDKYDALVKKNIFTGYPDGTAGLSNDMTRAEFAKVLTKVMGLKEVTGVHSYNDAGYNNPKNWAAPYIEAVSAAGVMQGQDLTKKLFNQKANVTVQELAEVLVKALKLEIPTDIDNTATEWAKGSVQAAINAGLISKDLNFQANAKRSLLVESAFAAEAALNVPTPVDATKIDSVTASNLREVNVKFDGYVDAATAGDESNYSITGEGNPVVTAVALSDDKKSATLTVEQSASANKGLVNQKEYKLSVMNVRAGKTVITASDVKFTPVDASLPVAQTAQALGNKTVKITFSEPVQVANANNFMVNGKTIVGTTEVTGNVVILKMYNILENAEYTLTAAGIQDFSGLKSLSTDLKFTVVEDKVSPAIVSVEKATFEEVTLKFSEPVDKASVLASNIYWMQGGSKMVASEVKALADDTYKFTFSPANRLVYTTDLFVTGVKDYSGNQIAADSKITVNPVVDQTRPEVVNATLQDDLKTIRVKFSKDVVASTATNGANYVIKDADGKVVFSLKEVTATTEAKTFDVKLYQKLGEGKKYTLEITGVTDTTTLKNVLVPYTKEIITKDVSAPTVTGVTYIANSNRAVVNFSEVMATSGDGSIVDASKYSYQDNGGAWKTLPTGSYLNVSSDGKAAIIVFPSDIVVGVNVTAIRVSLVKDVAGNYLDGLQAQGSLVAASAIVLNGAPTATANNKIEIPFNQELQAGSATPSDFTVKAGTKTLLVSSADVDGKNVVLTLADSNKLDSLGKYDSVNVTVDVKANGYLATAAGKQVEANQTTLTVTDKIAPAIKSVDKVTSATYAVNVTFTEAITLGNNSDIQVVVGSKSLVEGTDYTVAHVPASATANVVTITLTPAAHATNKGKVLEVRVKPYPAFITDGSGNLVTGNDSFYSSYIEL